MNVGSVMMMTTMKRISDQVHEYNLSMFVMSVVSSGGKVSWAQIDQVLE